MNKDTNIIKQACAELGITQKELAERLGVKEQSIRNASASGKITTQLESAIKLLLENDKLKKKVSRYTLIAEIIDEMKQK